MSRLRGLLRLSLRRTVLFSVVGAGILALAGCAGGTDSPKKKQSSEPRTTLPPGGTREILKSGQAGSKIMAVVYGGSGEVKNPRFDATPSAGNHFVAVKIGLKNLGTKSYTDNPALSASVTSKDGKVSDALDAGKRGLGTVKLKQGEFTLGRLFFEVADGARLNGFSFRPFGPTSKVVDFRISHGKSAETKRSKEPLPAGGTRKILRGTQAGSVVAAVVYGSSGEVKESQVGTSPGSGNHFVAIKVGFKNMGSRPYALDPTRAAVITNNKDAVFKAVPDVGLGEVDLEHNETAFGRVFFELADDTKVRSFRFRPFGTKGKLAVLELSHGETKPAVASTKPLPDGGTSQVVQRGGTTLKAVVYGATDNVNPDDLAVKPKPGNHLVAINLGLRNMQGGLYRANPPLSASITTDAGTVAPALPAPPQGIGKIALKQDEGISGRIFFAIKDKTRPFSFRFRPFGAADKAVVFKIARAGSRPVDEKLPTEAKGGTPEPLPSGGIQRVVTHGGTSVKAVVYGAQDVPPAPFAQKPPAGYHVISMDIGLRNMGPGSYRGTPFLTTSITNTRGEVSKAMRTRFGLGKVVLKPDRGVFGRLFFQLEDHTKPAQVRIRVFGYGPGTKATVFTIQRAG